jgi:hypothetical protein
MEKEQKSKYIVTVIGWGLLLIWWGVSFAVDPITIGISAIGTGLILLGVYAVCMLLGIPARGSTVALGVVTLVWGTLDTVFRMSFGGSFAVLLIVIGTTMIFSLVPRLRTA